LSPAVAANPVGADGGFPPPVPPPYPPPPQESIVEAARTARIQVQGEKAARPKFAITIMLTKTI